MSSWLTRTVLSGSSIDPNGTNSHTCTFTAATEGNLLVAIVTGAITFTTPSGWTLQQSAVAGAGLYVFTKIATAGESSFSTTHNGSNYAIRGVVYEYPSGTNIINSSSTNTAPDSGTVTVPSVSGLSGTYTRFSVRSHGMSTGTSTGNATWTTPANRDYNAFVSSGAQTGIFLSIATDDEATGSSFAPSYAVTLSNDSGNGEGISFALQVPKWLKRTVLSGSSVNPNGTNSHTCTFTAATSGNFLVAVVAGSVTSSTPTGWTLVNSAVNNTGIYVFTKTASSGESSFSTTHNGSNYPIQGVIYEFPAGTSVLGSNSATGQNGTATGPQVSSLTGTFSSFTARSWGMSQTISTSQCGWTLPTVEDYDAYTPSANDSQDGVALTIAYDDSTTGTSFNPSSTVSNTATAPATGESVAYALRIPPWVNRTIPTGTSVNRNGTTSHTVSFTAATTNNLLVAVVAAAATCSTPSGWTLATSGVDGAAIYVFYKVASSGESSFTTTHNVSNFPMMAAVYEFPAGSTIIGSNSATGQDFFTTGPQVTGLTGTYTRMSARTRGLNSSGSTATVDWTLPTDRDYDSYVAGGTTDGVGLSIAFDSNSTGSSFNPSSTIYLGGTSYTSGEGVSWAVRLGASYPMIETLTDNFNDNAIDGSKWNINAPTGTSVAETSSQLAITPPTSPTTGYGELFTTQPYSLLSSSLIVEIAQFVSAAASSAQQAILLQSDSNNLVRLTIMDTNLELNLTTGGSSDSTYVTRNDTNQHWLRIRESGGTIYFDSSPDRSTWTNMRSVSSTFSLAALYAYLQAGTWSAQASPGVAKFDNLNLPGSYPWVNRTVLSGSSVDKNGTNSHTVTFTAATAGNFLVAVVAGSVTSTTPSGWTLLTSAVNNSAIYVFTKTASSGESSFSTTHNGSNYAIKGVVYEFAAGTTAIGSNGVTGLNVNATETGPSVSSLTGTYTRMSARSYPMILSGSTGSADWTLPTTEDLDTSTPNATTDGIWLGVAYDANSTGSSFNPSAYVTINNTSGLGEGVSWALAMTAGNPTAITAWFRF